MSHRLAFLVAFLTCFGLAIAQSGWKIKFDGCDSHPVLHDSIIYIGSYDGAVYAVLAATGELKWRHQTGEGLAGGPYMIEAKSNKLGDQIDAALDAMEKSAKGRREISATPVVHEGVVYIGSQDHCIYALKADSGELLWRTELAGPIHHEVLITENTVVAHCLGALGGFGSDNPSTIHVLDLSDGKIRWSTEEEWHITYPAIHDSIIYFGSYPGVNEDEIFFRVFSADIQTGGLLWTAEFNGRRPDALVYSDGICYVSAFDGGRRIKKPGGSVSSTPTVARIFALETSSGNLLWDYTTEDEILAFRTPPLTLDDEYLFFVTENGLSAVRKANGELGWFLNGQFSPWSVLLEDNLYIKVSSRSRKEPVLAVNPATGKTLWQSKPGKNLWIESATDDAVYVSDGPSLIAFSTVNGKKLWRFKTGGLLGGGAQICAPPVAFEGQLIFPSETNYIMGSKPIQGHLYSISADKGKLKRRK